MKKDITFVGLDVHATSIALAVLPPGADVPVDREIPNDPKLIRRTFTRLTAEADRRFEATLKRLHQRLDTDSFERMDELNKALASLVIERDTLARLSTWPWRPETLRGFLTSVALPVVVWYVTSVLGRLLEV